MKKKILFVIDSLHCAGAEKSLVSLLNLIDFQKYDIDLQLFGYNGILEELIPREVNLLEPLEYTKFISNSIIDNFKKSYKIKNLKMLKSRIAYSIAIKGKSLKHSQIARIYWEKVREVIENNNMEYDIAISYAQGVPTFYVVEKIKAKKKFAWVNVSYRLSKKDIFFQKQYYDKLDRIIAVSKSTKEIFLETFSCYNDKVKVIYDINNADMILNMANIGEGYNDNFQGIRILTIGRLEEQKGYDIALSSCKILKKNNIDFRWYSLGVGPLEHKIKAFIKENNLEENFKLLGITNNPYGYIKNSDIYVQTSRFEGFGLAIAEARMLNIPVVTTEFDAVYNQMVQRKNGLVVEMNGEAVAKGIIEMIDNKELRESIIEYLRKEKKGNVEEINKFYELIEG